ncbi:MAG: PDDEXK nuclease domain-containing protein [Bacilli bacterium]
MEDKYYINIKEYLIGNEAFKKVKDYSKNKNDLITYYNVGKELSEAGKHYGEGIIKKYSKKLKEDLNKVYSYRSLNYMIRYYEFQKVQSVTANLSWGHWIELLSIKNIDEIRYYIFQTEMRCLTTKKLREIIKLNEYGRIPSETRNKLNLKSEVNIKELVPNPILIRNKKNIEIINEKVLHNLILEDIESFMNELGNNFSFIGSEYKIKIGDNYHKIDLLLFNIKYNAYVVVELKVTEFKAEYISQVQKYMNYIDKNIKEISNNNTIGILICKKENKFVIEYCSDDRIAVREYELV